jgi:16S rRNA (adenine1518-N6/adenine1519-N6)-dimethyltransferase
MKILPKKSLGQNFLIDKKILNQIAKLGEINENETVIEVGPGTGNLTEEILKKKPKNFIVIEKDKNFIEILKRKFDNKIEIINEDILKFSHDKFYNNPIIIFGNLPYNISTQILINWIRIEKLENYCKKFILMFQKEVADRIIAKDNSKDYGRLSILSSWKMNIKKIMDINPGSFFPTPNVKSSLLILEPKTNYYKLKNPKNLEHVTNVFFNQRRKMIKKPMKVIFKNFEDVAKSLSLDLNLRPQNLSKLSFYKICSYYEKLLK